MTDPRFTGLAPAAAAPPRASAAQRRKRPEDTPGGCRDFAAADLGRAAESGVEQARHRYQKSAAAWTARAEMLDRLEAKFQARISEMGE